MIGHMVLRKSVVEGSSHSSAAILGLKVVGGKLQPDGTRIAVVEKVKKGSIADLEGQLRIGECSRCGIFVKSRNTKHHYNEYLIETYVNTLICNLIG